MLVCRVDSRFAGLGSLSGPGICEAARSLPGGEQQSSGCGSPGQAQPATTTPREIERPTLHTTTTTTKTTTTTLYTEFLAARQSRRRRGRRCGESVR